jgi:ribonucleoside-triphosphate reductase
VFWNISVFDKYYFDGIFGGFRFPDGTEPDYKSLSRLQEFFMEWFRMERKKELLTYPVLTAAVLLDEDKKPKDKDFAWFLAEEMSKGLSFFIYESRSADSLASCCRLRNELADNTFSYTLGAGGVSTGSFRVITINMNRYVQQYEGKLPFGDLISRIHKYLAAHRAVIKHYIELGMLPAYTAQFINFDTQFGTIGINGMLEAMEYKGFSPVVDKEAYQKEVSKYLKVIYDLNKADRAVYGFRFNTEYVPAEGLGVKNAQWDKHDGLSVPRDCYNSYFFPVENDSLTILDKLFLHGKETTKYLDGGSACHLNIAQLFSKNQAYDLICVAGRLGVNYWTYNCLVTICNDCGYINVNTEDHCTECGSHDVDYGTRVIGYLKRISSYSKERQSEAARRFYVK